MRGPLSDFVENVTYTGRDLYSHNPQVDPLSGQSYSKSLRISDFVKYMGLED